MSSIAYALRREHHDTYVGGVLVVGDDSLDVRQQLEDGNGVIVVPEDDMMKTMVLDSYPPLERVPVPSDDRPALPVGYMETDAPPADPLAQMSVKDLRDHAKELGVENPGRSREEIVEAITQQVTTPPAGTAAADSAPAAGESAPDTTTEG